MGQQRHEARRRELAFDRIERQPEQGAGGPAAERQAGGIIGLDATAPGLARQALGEAASRRDQRGTGAGLLQHFAQGQGCDQRLLALVGCFADA